ncbi:MAG: YqaE/Pmp3 family membrane protein [Phycisphaerales bacterium]
MLVIKIILAIFLPPVAALLQVGVGLHFWLNILLTILGWLPGQIHAIWLIASKHEPSG